MDICQTMAFLVAMLVSKAGKTLKRLAGAGVEKFDILGVLDKMNVFHNFQAMNVQTLTSAKVQANFGAAADIAKSGEPVTITQYGRPTLILFSYKEGKELLRLRAVAELSHYFEGRTKTMPQGEPELSLDDINDLVHELRP